MLILLLFIIWLIPIAAFLLRYALCSELVKRIQKGNRLYQICALICVIGIVAWGGVKPNMSMDSNSIDEIERPSNNLIINSIVENTAHTTQSELTNSNASLDLGRFGFSEEEISTGFVLTGVSTNEHRSFAIPANGIAYEPWLKYGASDDVFIYEQDTPIMELGTNAYNRARIYSQGSVQFEQNLMVNVLDVVLGISPTNNWCEVESPMLWYLVDRKSTIFTWHDVLLNRISEANVSFQLEIKNSGDIIAHYDRRTVEFIKAGAVDFDISVLNNNIENLAYNNTCSTTNHTCASIYNFSSNGGVNVSHLCEIINECEVGISLYWTNISNLNHTSSDEDNDGISNFEEICIYKTDCYNADTDGDNRSDSHEVQNGFSAVNADENNDSVPDGIDSDEWASHPLWCTNNTPSIIISLDTPIPAGTSASLMLNDLTIPLSETNSWSLTLPQGELVNVRLQSTGTEPIDLSLSYPNSDTQNYNNSVWIDDPAGIFDGAAFNQDVARMCVPTVRFYDDKTKTFIRSICLHHSSESYRDLRIVFSPKEFQDSIIVENITLEELELIGENLVRISIQEESDASFGYLTYEWFCQYFEYRHVFGMVDIHRCNSIHNEGYCTICSYNCIDFDNIKVDINGDYNRSGNLIDHENEGNAVLFNNSHGMVIPVNNNDTNLDGVPDCNDEEINGLDDLNELKRIRIEALNIPPYFADDVSAKLKIYTLASDIDTSRIVTDKVRIYNGTTIFAEPFNFVHDGEGIYSTNLSDDQVKELCTNSQELLIEGCWHGSQINISLEIRINGTLFKSDYISILTAPFFVLSNCDQAKKLFMGYYLDWSEVYNSITNSNFLDIPIEIDGHSYLQDYAEFGASIDSNGEYYPVIMDFNSNNFNDETSPNTGFFSLAAGGQGGNIEGLPVSEQHPYGRVIVGSTLKNRQPQIYKFLKNQKIQGELIELDTDWLKVGHVDEIISVVPTANSYKIFVFDTQLAIDIFATNVNNSTIFYPEILNKTYSSYTNLQNQTLVNFMTNRTAEIFTTLSNNNIETMQIVSVPVLFSLGVQSASDQESHSECILFNPLNSVYLNVNGENKAILSVGLYAPYCSYYFDLLVTLGYNNGNILPINTILMQNGGGSIHCATNIKRER